jgi:hypothetical protein
LIDYCQLNRSLYSDIAHLYNRRNLNYTWEITRILLRNRDEIPNREVVAVEESSNHSSEYYEEASSFNSHSSHLTDFAYMSDTNFHFSDEEDTPTDTESWVPGLIGEHLVMEIS